MLAHLHPAQLDGPAGLRPRRRGPANPLNTAHLEAQDSSRRRRLRRATRPYGVGLPAAAPIEREISVVTGHLTLGDDKRGAGGDATGV